MKIPIAHARPQARRWDPAHRWRVSAQMDGIAAGDNRVGGERLHIISVARKAARLIGARATIDGQVRWAQGMERGEGGRQRAGGQATRGRPATCGERGKLRAGRDLPMRDGGGAKRHAGRAREKLSAGGKAATSGGMRGASSSSRRGRGRQATTSARFPCRWRARIWRCELVRER